MAMSGAKRVSFERLFDFVYIGTLTVDPADLAAGAEATSSLTVTGAAVGDLVFLAPGTDLTTVLVSQPQVTAADTVKVTFSNPSGDHINIASSTWNVIVLRPSKYFTSAGA